MNEFTAKKLGEVLAFCRTGLLLHERSAPAIASALGAGQDANFAESLRGHAAELERIANGNETTLKKAEATTAKLTKMMELYIGDEWDNPAEIMEWLGFFEGSAIVHWQLVAGAGGALNHSEISAVAERAIVFHKTALDQVAAGLNKIGAAKATA